MTSSRSTPRLRVTQVWYLIVLLLVAVGNPRGFNGLSGTFLDLLGLLLMLGAALGRIWCSLFIAGHKDERLVTSGPYSLCRNPLYVLSLLGGLGLGLATRSPTLTLATLVILGLLHARAIRAEEKFLGARHGVAFERYCAEVPRLWPVWKSGTALETMTVNPRIYWKSFLDAGSFLLLYAAVQLLHALRMAGLLPTLFGLY